MVRGRGVLRRADDDGDAGVARITAFRLDTCGGIVARAGALRKDRTLPPMATDPFVLRDADLRTWRGEFADVTPLDELRPRHKATCVGVVHKIRVVPGRQLEVTIEDGSGRVTAVFTGRSNLPGLELGAGLRLSGTVAEDRDGGLVIRNPTWAPVSEPYR